MFLDTPLSPSLTPEALDHYNRDGFLVLKRVFTPDDVAAMASEAQTPNERRELIDVNNIRSEGRSPPGNSREHQLAV